MQTLHTLRIKRYCYLLILLFFGIAPLRAQLKNTPQDSLLFERNNFKITATKATHNDTVIYNTKKDSLNFFKNNITEPTECKVFFSSHYNPLSLVGPYYSYEYGVATQEACGLMGNTLGIATVNINTMQKVTLQELFTEKSLLKALKNDSWIKELGQLNNIPISKIKTFKTFLYFLSDTTSMQFSTQSFAVLDYNSATNEAQVRFVAQEYIGYDHNKHFQLGLTLQPKENLKEVFKSQIDFKLGAYKNGLIK
ncbi:hypothetical protein H0I23_04125 [Cellulophaga sp. HaHaR_3_176]|uniref:hypothetical protein n=1 Tax=Cellulophaga sp. HaHaR_3_176 TaxID=1942464 RepID=UPI001C1FBAE6|nr:hypothetical protein [Cellulophaga sp. HaHaR_3_176]QWX84837.1 hypothetical protein H0I23_04125 [Cellulophaga sp. HaHaR_3_176]